MTEEEIVYECPHCQRSIIIIELNCKIFRCGIFKDTGKQLNPHASKDECDRVLKENLIYGCGKPFRITHDKKLIICDYI